MTGFTLFAMLLVIVFLVAWVVLAKDLLRAAVALALASVGVSVVLFLQGAWMAAFFELSVCAGLITVLFVSTLSLTKDSDQHQESRISGNPFFLGAALLAFLALDVFAVRWISGQLTPPALASHENLSFAVTFWSTRTTDIIGQVALLLAGVFAILALFKRQAHGRKHD